MLLRIRPEHVARSQELLPGLRDDIVDAVEIMEDPGYLMARVPGQAAWPRPGEPGFSWDPRVFVPVDKLVEILSCGYHRGDALSDYFGACFTDANAIAALQAARDVMQKVTADPSQGESLERWSARNRLAPDSPLTEYFFRESQATAPVSQEVIVVRNVVHPPELAPAFAVVGYWAAGMVRNDISRSVASTWIRDMCIAAGVTEARTPGILGFSYWRGSGEPRLIIPDYPS
jgi:hypothetical protein